MKIIRPIDLTAAGAVSSNAPVDPYEAWSPVGRDFATEIGDPILGSGGNLTFICDENPDATASLSKINLATGEINRGVIDTPFIRVASIQVSPDDAFVAVSGTISGGGPLGSDSNVLRVYATDIFDIKYSSGVFNDHRMKWLPDSSGLVYISATDDLNYGNPRYMEIGLVNSGTWTKTSGADFQTIASNTSSRGVFRTSELAINDTSTAVFFGLVSGTYVTGDVEFDQLIVRVDLPSFTYSTNLIEPISYARTLGFCAHNLYRSEIVIGVYSGTTRSVRAYDDSSLSEKTMGIANPSQVWGLIPSPDTDELIVRPLSTTPSYRRVVASTYAEGVVLDGIQDQQTKEVSYSDDYYVFANTGGGYSLIQRSDDTLVTQTNPNVTVGDIYTYDDRNYEALSDNNDRPDLGARLEVPTWLDLGAINPLRMFDGKLDSLTTGPSPLVIDVTPGQLVNGIALFNVSASTVQITYTDPTDGLVYDTDQISMIDNSGVQDLYSFFFDPYLVKSDLALVDLPAYIDGTIQIALDGAGGDVAVGEIVVGSIYQIGDAQHGSSAGILDFSRKEQDQFGNFEIVPRRFSKRAEFDTVIPPAYGGSVQRTLARLRATPVVWIGSVDREETIVYGYFREFDILLSNPALSNVTITVEGL